MTRPYSHIVSTTHLNSPLQRCHQLRTPAAATRTVTVIVIVKPLLLKLLMRMSHVCDGVASARGSGRHLVRSTATTARGESENVLARGCVSEGRRRLLLQLTLPHL